MNRPIIAWYVSGHGFGHATRACAAIQQVPSEIDIEIITSVPRWLFECSLRRPFTYREMLNDPGLIQLDCIEFDPNATAQVWRQLLHAYLNMAEREAARYQARSPLVVGDISPLAVLVAERLGTQSVCVANFSWDWILEPTARHHEALQEIRLEIREIYRRCGLLLRTPFHGGLVAFQNVRDVGVVVRRPTLGREEARRHFGLPSDRPIVLISFGGHDQDGVTPDILARYSDFLFIRVGKECNAANYRAFPSETYHPDLVAASDIVFGKLGYGIVAESLAADADLLHLERHGFPEHGVFLEELPHFIHLQEISRDDFRRGNWNALRNLAARRETRPPQSPYTNLNGGVEVAHILCELLERKS